MHLAFVVIIYQHMITYSTQRLSHIYDKKIRPQALFINGFQAL